MLKLCKFPLPTILLHFFNQFTLVIIHHGTLWEHFQGLVCLDQEDAFVFSLRLILILVFVPFAGWSWRMKLDHFWVNYEGCIRRTTSRSGQGWSFPSAQPCWDPSGELCPVLGSPAQERHRHRSKSCPGSPKAEESDHLRRDWSILPG